MVHSLTSGSPLAKSDWWSPPLEPVCFSSKLQTFWPVM
jgi:hypothetical protein